MNRKRLHMNAHRWTIAARDGGRKQAVAQASDVA